jgi:hypothetical protein
MKHTLFTLFLTVMMTSQSWSQDTWVKTFGGTVDGCGYSISPTEDDGIVLTGWTQSNDGHFLGIPKSKLDIYVMKLDSNGNLIPSGNKKSKKK